MMNAFSSALKRICTYHYLVINTASEEIFFLDNFFAKYLLKSPKSWTSMQSRIKG